MDVAERILPLWNTPGDRFGLSQQTLGDAPPSERRDALIKVLADEYQRVAATAVDAPTGLNPSAVADSALRDLIEPFDVIAETAELARQELLSYTESKHMLFSERRGRHTCPICNGSFDQGQAAREAFLLKPKTFTNRAIAMGRLGNVVICPECRVEAIFRQVMLGGRAENLLVLFPRLNVGHGQGLDVLRRAEGMRQAFAQMLDRDRPAFSLATTWYAAGEVLHLQDAPTPEELARLYTYAPNPPSRGRLVRDVVNRIEDEYAAGLDDFNEYFQTNFATLEDAADAVLDHQLPSTDVIDLLPTEAQPGRPPAVVCRTPNLILVPLRGPIQLPNDSEADAAIRTVFVAISFGLAFGASAMIMPAGAPPPGDGGEGVAWVPPIPSVRDLFDGEWITEGDAKKIDAETWLRAIAAAARLGEIYPERSSLLRGLSATSPGEIARRYEQSGEQGLRILGWDQIRLIELIRPVLRAASYGTGNAGTS